MNPALRSLESGCGTAFPNVWRRDSGDESLGSAWRDCPSLPVPTLRAFVPSSLSAFRPFPSMLLWCSVRRRLYRP